MPVESNIELGSGQIYFKGLDEPVEVYDCEVDEDIEWADDQTPVIRLSTEPVELTINNAEFARDWTIVKCRECGYGFPVTEMYALLYGTNSWRCPRCTLNRIREAARSRQEHRLL